MKDFLKLYLYPNSSEYIVFITEDDDLEKLTMYQHIYIQYRNQQSIHHRNQQSIHLTYDWFYTFSKYFCHKLQDAINNKLQLDPSIKKDLGYEYNNLIYKSAHDRTINLNNWIGQKYLLIDTNGSTPQSGFLWIYNDKKDNVVLTITPPFANLFFKAYPEEEPISFDEWMKDYKPLLITKISKETAQQWIKDIDNLVIKIQHNDTKNYIGTKRNI